MKAHLASMECGKEEKTWDDVAFQREIYFERSLLSFLFFLRGIEYVDYKVIGIWL